MNTRSQGGELREGLTRHRRERNRVRVSMDDEHEELDQEEQNIGNLSFTDLDHRIHDVLEAEAENLRRRTTALENLGAEQTQTIRQLNIGLNEKADESVMQTSTNLAPKVFTGIGNTSPRQFLRQFTKWSQYCRWSDERKLASVVLYLSGLAESWYFGLTAANRPRTFPEFEDMLIANFETDSTNLINSQLFHSCKQGENEDVDMFLNRLRKLAARINATEIDQRNQFLAGLNDRLRITVLPQSPENLLVAHSKALLAQQALQTLTPKTRVSEVKDSNIVRDIEILKEQMNSIKILLQNKEATTAASNNLQPKTEHQGRLGARDSNGRGFVNDGVRCYVCNRYGHIARNCYSRVNQRDFGNRNFDNRSFRPNMYTGGMNGPNARRMDNRRNEFLN